MTLRTLIIRYRKVGYIPKLVQDEFIIYDIINFLYEKHNIHVSVLYHSMKISEEYYLKFVGSYMIRCGEEHSNTFYCDKYFKNPNDALFDAVVKVLPGLKFRLNIF